MMRTRYRADVHKNITNEGPQDYNVTPNRQHTNMTNRNIRSLVSADWSTCRSKNCRAKEAKSFFFLMDLLPEMHKSEGRRDGNV